MVQLLPKVHQICWSWPIRWSHGEWGCLVAFMFVQLGLSESGLLGAEKPLNAVVWDLYSGLSGHVIKAFWRGLTHPCPLNWLVIITWHVCDVTKKTHSHPDKKPESLNMNHPQLSLIRLFWLNPEIFIERWCKKQKTSKRVDFMPFHSWLFFIYICIYIYIYIYVFKLIQN